MANWFDIGTLKRGSRGWNQWRAEHPGTMLDFHGANLSQLDLSSCDLSKLNLSGANLSGANLRQANLSEANLSGANLHGADLSGANLSGADLSQTSLVETILRNTRLDHIRLTDARFQRTDLRGLPWVLLMELTLQAGVTFQDIRYDYDAVSDEVR